MKFLTPGPARTMRAAALPLTVAVCGLLAVRALAAAPTPQPVDFGTLIQGARSAAEHVVAHYTTDGGPGFVFDTAATRPLLKFDNSGELWALTASPGPRGDTIYKNDVGQTMLTVARIGGMTVYPRRNAKGIAADFDRPTDRLGLHYILNQLAFDVITGSAATALKRSLPSLKGFDVGNGDVPEDKKMSWAGLAVDAANLTAETIGRLGQTPANHKVLDKLTFVRITYADKPGVRLSKDELLIDIAPVLGVPGRPSSAKIEAALGIH